MGEQEPTGQSDKLTPEPESSNLLVPSSNAQDLPSQLLDQVSAIVKTPSMIALETKLGEPLETVLQRLFVTEDRPRAEVATMLELKESTLKKYLHLLQIDKSKFLVQELEERFHANLTDVLTQKYIDEFKSAIEIARELGVSQKQVLSWLHEHQIPIRPLKGTARPVTKRQLEETFGEPVGQLLKRLYEKEERSLEQVGKALSISATAVRKLLEGEGISIRPQGLNLYREGEPYLKVPDKLAKYRRKGESEKDVLQRLLRQNKTVLNLASLFDINESYAYELLKKYDILPPRQANPEVKILQQIRNAIGPNPHDTLQTLLDQGLSQRKIASKYGVTHGTISRWLKLLDIDFKD